MSCEQILRPIPTAVEEPLLAPAIKYIFAKMRAIHNSPAGAWQRQFLPELSRVLFAMRGRVNVTNMARYSSYVEQTFRRHFRKAFDWVAFNRGKLNSSAALSPERAVDRGVRL